MARPPAKELTHRELEIMHVFWRHGELTAADVRAQLAKAGRDLAYTTVATLVRILAEKSCVRQTNQQRPFRFRAERSYQEVSQRLLGDFVDRVFHGSRAKLLLHLMEDDELSGAERAILQKLVEEE